MLWFVGERYLSRRDLLRQGAFGAMALGAAGAVAGSALSSCSAPSRSAGPLFPVTPTTAPAEVAGSPYWLRGNFAPVTVETTTTDLRVTGSLPAELTGLYVRNGSNPLRGTSPHWFLGDGMVHGLALEDGKALWYRNRYVETGFWRNGGGLGAGPPGGASSLSNVSVGPHAGRLLSLGEVGLPFELNPADLSTVGPIDFGGKLTGNFTAHPKVDPSTGDLHGFGYNFTAPYLTYYVVDAAGNLTTAQDVDIPAATMMHDFAITDSDVIFMDLPVAFDMTKAIEMVSTPGSQAVPFEWKPSLGARLGVMPLGGPTSKIRWVDIEPCYVYHTVNAWRQGTDIKLEVCRLDNTFTPPGTPSAATRRIWTIATAGRDLRFSEEILDVPPADLPTMDHRYRGRPSTQSWLGEVVSSSGSLDFTGCQHLNTATGVIDRWIPDRGRTSGEWCFVPTGAAEGEGYAMAFVFDPSANTSSLVVLDAQDVASGPVAEIPLPVRVPYGFHGAFVRA